MAGPTGSGKSDLALLLAKEFDGEIVNCEVLDLSLSGVSLGTEMRPPIGEFVLIGQMAGRVVRHHDTGIGITFVAGMPEKTQNERGVPKLNLNR